MNKKAQDMIKEGIETGDMELIKAGHALLEKPKKPRGRPKKVSPDLTKPEPEPILKKDELDFSFPIRTEESKRARGKGETLARREQVDLSKIGKNNTFQDNKELVPVIDSDKKLYILKPVPRRENTNLVQAECMDCGDKRIVSQKIAKNGYKCDQCLIKKGKYRP